jgi:sulfite reductase alpha subunit-like flavoprotein
MEPAVYETLARILSGSDDEDDSSGVEKLEALVQQGRYLTDVFA